MKADSVYAAFLAALVGSGLCTSAPAGETERFPTAATTGVPQGWIPKRVEHADIRITTAGSVLEDTRIVGADLLVDADNVTVRRVEIVGGRIRNDPVDRCRNGLLVEDVSILPDPQVPTSDKSKEAIGPGGYTARRVKLDGVAEGFRVGGRSVGCGEVVIENSYARIVAPTICGDWHGDGIQGYDGPRLVVRNVSLELVERLDCGGTAPFFYPADQGNTDVDIDGLRVAGGGYPFRLGTTGAVRALQVANNSWGYAPFEVDCRLVKTWDASIAQDEKPGSMPRASRRMACGANASR